MVKTKASESPSISIPSWLCGYINQQQFNDIEQAIVKAELTTSGEIVPVIVRGNDHLLSPRLFLMTIFSLLFVLCAERMVFGWESTGELICLGLAGLVFTAAGFYLPSIAFVRRIVTANSDARFAAERRAELEFYRAGIASTQGQTGILLMLSIEDHQAVVLADKGISSKLPPETWNEVLKLMIDGIKNNNCSQGMIQAIAKCGEILSEHFPIAKNDANELVNHLMIKE